MDSSLDFYCYIKGTHSFGPIFSQALFHLKTQGIKDGERQ